MEKPKDRKTIIAAVRAELEKTGGQRLSFKKFLAATGWGRYDISCRFDSWHEVMLAAGAPYELRGRRIPRERLLADWGSVAWKLKRIPTAKSYKIHGKYGFSTLSRCFGRWAAVKTAFCEYAAGKEEWKDILALVEGRKMLAKSGKMKGRRWVTANLRQRGVVHFGEPLPFPEMRNAPVNENGILYLFGVLAGRLGFSVEAVRGAFPDCIAKRRIGVGDWENVRIEFEYESRNFQIHQHDPRACDLIVCWVHNWPDCPRHIEVIALRDEAEKYSQTRGSGN